MTQKACLYQPDGSGKMTESAIPADMADAAATAREQLIEMVAEADESLMEKFFEAGTLTQEQLVEGLRSATAAGKIFPLLCTSGALDIGVQPLLDAIVNYVPSPAARPIKMVNARTGEEVERPLSESGPGSAFVWKTIADPFAGRITMFRVMSGVLKTDSTVHNKTRDVGERLGHIVLLQGKTQTNVPELRAGDLGAVPKLKDTLTNDTLGDKGDPAVFPALKFPEPVLSSRSARRAGATKTRSAPRCTASRRKIRPSSDRDPQTNELLLSGQGQLHIEVTVAKLKRRFGVDVNLKPPRIPYRETIKSATEAHGRHKKQTGGHGQFGDCKIKVEPLPRGTDSSSWTIFSGARFRGSSSRPWKKASRKRECAAISPATRWWISA